MEEQIEDNKEVKQIKKRSVKENYFLNLAYEMFLIIVPLITTPYVSRVLTAEGVGKYSFVYSLITYFTLFGALGFGRYAQREIAKHQNDLKEQSKAFWEINVCRLLPVCLSLLVNIILCSFSIYGTHNELMWIFNINIIALAFDIAYLFQGNEDFGKLVLRSFIIKCITVACIFIFVKSTSDLWIYTLIQSLSVLISNLSMWIVSHKYLVKVDWKELKPFKHLKGTCILFLPTIATSIYTVLDKTLIGFLITETYTIEETQIIDGVEQVVQVVKKYSDLENGYYEQAEKLVKMVLTVITAIGTVMTPRNTNEIACGNNEQVKKNINISCQLVLLLGVPMMFGISAIAGNLVPWFLGEGYDKAILLMQVLSPLIVIIGFSNVYGNQYLVPSGQDGKFTLALVAGSVTNLILNIIFIQLWWSVGAAIATIVAECVVTGVMAFMCRKEVKFFKIILNGWRYFIAGILMFAVCYFIGFKMSSSIVNTLLIALIGVIVYFSLLLILRDNLIFIATTQFKERINKIKQKNLNDFKFLKGWFLCTII